MRDEWKASKIRSAAVLLALTALVAAPLLALIIGTLAELLRGNGSWLALAVPTGRRAGLLLKSLGFSSAVALGSVLISVPAALLMREWKSRAGGVFLAAVLLTAAVPSYIYALSWTSAFNGLSTLGVHFTGFAAAWWVEMMATVPFSLGITLLGFQMTDNGLIDSARMLRDDFTILRKAVIPTSAAFILSGSAFVFLYSLMDYSIPSLFQLDTYTLEIFTEYSANYSTARAFLLSMPLLAAVAAVVAAVFPAFKGIALKIDPRAAGISRPFALPAWVRGVQKFTVFLLALQLLVPLVNLIGAARSPGEIAASFEASADQFGNTFLISAAAALIGVVLAAVLADQIHFRREFRPAFVFLALFPLAIPAPLIGIGLVTVWNRPELDGIYGSFLMPALAGAIRFLPFAAAVILARYRLAYSRLFDAALVFQPNARKTLLRVKLPLLAKALFAAACILFVLSAGELGATLLVAPPGMETLTVKIYNFLHYGESGTVAGLCLAMFVLSMGAGLIAAKAMTGKSAGRRKGMR